MNTVKFLFSLPFLFAVLFFGFALKVVKVLGNGILIALAATVASLWGFKTPEECPFVRGMLIIHFGPSRKDKEEEARKECLGF